MTSACDMAGASSHLVSKGCSIYRWMYAEEPPSRRPLLCSSWRRQRGLERGRIYPGELRSAAARPTAPAFVARGVKGRRNVAPHHQGWTHDHHPDAVCRDWMAERDGFEPEISLAVLPRTQSETPVPVPAVNAGKLPMDGCAEGHHRLAGSTNSWRSLTLGQCARCV